MQLRGQGLRVKSSRVWVSGSKDLKRSAGLQPGMVYQSGYAGVLPAQYFRLVHSRLRHTIESLAQKSCEVDLRHIYITIPPPTNPKLQAKSYAHKDFVG